MSNRRKGHLDELERRLTGSKRIALFGHRAVGKTTLLAMLYREAAGGRVPGVRLAAADPASAEYLAEKIARIEAGEPLAGTLAETALRLRLYHDHARFDLVVKDYQGEHVTLGTDAPIQAFFADSDAVLLCLDPSGEDKAADRHRRQQEIEDLLERYIERSEDATANRPVALLLTKYDRVVDRGGPPPEQVERLVESRYGMTRHALARHVPRSAMFAVSSYGQGASGDGRPPADLQPTGLEGPLGWLADQLEARDRELLDWIWDLAPDDLPRLSRCVAAFKRRYPRSDQAETFQTRLIALHRRHKKRGVVRLVGTSALLALGLAVYDAWGYRAALAFERDEHSPIAVEQRWADLLVWHPSLPWIWPGEARQARRKYADWRVKATGARLIAGTAGPDVGAEMSRLKEENPALTLSIKRQVEDVQQRQRHDEGWKALQVADLAAIERPDEYLSAVRKFLRDFPQTEHRAEAVKRVEALAVLVEQQRDRSDRQALDVLIQAGRLPNADLTELIRRAQEFLDEHPESRWVAEARGLRDQYAHRLDDLDFDRARQFSKDSPANFAVRRRKYQEYLQAHEAGGRHVREAAEALSQLERDQDAHLYRQAYDYAIAHPDDVASVASALRSYLNGNPDGRFAKEAGAYLAWWEKSSVLGAYRVVLRRGEVEPDVGKWLSSGGPDLGVVLWVGGVKYGPTPVAPNSRKPIWDYTFSRPIKWKYGDPVVVEILDFDWSSSGTPVARFNSPKGDRLAIRMLSGTIRLASGGRTSLTFASDFRMPTLPKPE